MGLKIYATLRRIVDLLATDLIENTREQVLASGARDLEGIVRAPHRLAGFSPAVAKTNVSLKQFLHIHLYQHPTIVEERDRSVQALDQLFHYYLEHPRAMPQHFAALAQSQPLHRVVCDYVAGMTDHFLLRQWRSLTGTPAPH